MPRFLFRGFNDSSGGNASLNTSDKITPHAFYGAGADVDPNAPGGKLVSSIPIRVLRAQVNSHLVGATGKSPFSSWTADWQTAINFAGIGGSAHIAVFDTSFKGQHTHVWHVPSLVQAGIATSNYIEEYLVYGPLFRGEAYLSCRSVDELRCFVEKRCKTAQGSFFSSAPATGSIDKIPGLLDQTHWIASCFARRVALDPYRYTLHLTVFAAELARHRTPSYARMNHSTLTLREQESIEGLFVIGCVIKRIAKCASGIALVNPLTYSDGLPQVKAMIEIMQFFEMKIAEEREAQLQESKAKSESQLNALRLVIPVVVLLGILLRVANSLVRDYFYLAFRKLTQNSLIHKRHTSVEQKN